MKLPFRRNVARMAGYEPGEQPQEGGFVKLNTNENPYPPSPLVRRSVLAEVGASLRLYPDPGATRLRRQAAGQLMVSSCTSPGGSMRGLTGMSNCAAAARNRTPTRAAARGAASRLTVRVT